MFKALVGPVLDDLRKIGLSSDQLVIATAFYSRPQLEALPIHAARIDLLVRLDTSDLTDWVYGAVAPDALLDFVTRHMARSIEVRLFVSPTSHAKVYLGSAGFLVGSANLTVRGFGGLADEILWYQNDRHAIMTMSAALQHYRGHMQRMDPDELRAFVEQNRDEVKRLRSRVPRQLRPLTHYEDRLPQTPARSPRLGSFDGFLRWLDGQPQNAAALIARRGRGEGNLSGHIRRNFFGLRQFFIARPDLMHTALSADPDRYALRRDAYMKDALRSFVRRDCVDEAELSVKTWRTYLPKSAGGKPKSGGGTSGNLKRMIPLIARYLKKRVG